MAWNVAVSERIQGGGRVTDSVTGIAQVAAYGGLVLPDLTLTLENGTGTGKANLYYLAKRTLAATTYDLLDLAGGLTAFNGATLTFTKIKRILVAPYTPDGTVKVRVGPQGQANPWVGPWTGGVGATVYKDVFFREEFQHPYLGWDVTAGTGDIFPVYNPGASSIDYAIWIIGEGS